jgi:pimeloyl-ACP methyl ester carboxylesterase
MIDANGATIRVTESGAGEPTLVFLHYWGGSSRTWHAVIERLAGQAHCIALDQRGWGKSIATDGRYDLAAMADDVEVVTQRFSLNRFLLVGHSMGGKVAQIVAGRRRTGLMGLVLVAPAPPTPMPVPEEQRAAMLASYGSREGVLQALSVLASAPSPDEVREQVIEDTLAGAPDAKRAWTYRGMIEDISAGLAGATMPTIVVVGDRDQVEHEEALRAAFARFLPQATFRLLEGVGHLSPLQAPDAIADACRGMLESVEAGEPKGLADRGKPSPQSEPVLKSQASSRPRV